MYEISKEFEFSAAHALEYLPSDHKCHNLHGHNYRVVFILQSNSLDNNQFVLDFTRLDLVKKWIDIYYDHKFLNEAMDTKFTTSEFIAYTLYTKFKKEFPMLYKVTVSETPKTTASYWEE